jgi:hypothetical protein
MASYNGRCVVKSVTGLVVLDHAEVSVDDQHDPRNYRSRPTWSGELTSDGSNLLREPFRSDPSDYVLEFDDGISAHVRFNSWSDGGTCAQIIGHGPWPFG